MLKKWLASLVALLTKGRVAQSAERIRRGPYEPGQVWSFHAGTDYKNALLIVLKTETLPGVGNVVHISIEGVALPQPDGTIATRIAHMPFSETAIDSSVTELVRSNEKLPDYGEYYDSWRRGDEDGGYGVFTVPVKVIIDGTMKASGT